jgi:hypothetical protein
MRSIIDLRPIIRKSGQVLCGDESNLSDRDSHKVVSHIAQLCKAEIQNWAKHPRKSEMLHKIQGTLQALATIEKNLSDSQIIEACGEAWYCAIPGKRTRYASFQTDLEFKALDGIESHRKVTLQKIVYLKSAFEFMIRDFRLDEREGRFRAWSNHHLEPKQFMTLLAMQLFMAVRTLSTPPGPNNSDFSEFLSLLWELCSGEADAADWTTPIRVARGKPYTKYYDRFHARYSAQLVADDLLNSIREYVEGFRPLEENEFKPPKLVSI